MGNTSSAALPDDLPSEDELATFSGPLKQGWLARIEAEKTLVKRFAGRSKFEDAAEMFESAAIKFKLAKENDEAAKCYARVAECGQKDGDEMKAASSFVLVTVRPRRPAVGFGAVGRRCSCGSGW